MTDYCEAQKESEMLALKRKFKVEINQDVLKTVNCDGSN
jgi:peptidyl-prolyl cis-trans isomerase SurA